MERIKIVFLIGGLGLGGSERQLFYILENLDRSVFDCQVVSFNPHQNYFSKRLRDIGVKVWEVPVTIKSVTKRIGFLYRLFRKIDPQIVHSWTFHDNPYAGLVGWAAGISIRLGSQRNEFSSSQIQKLPLIYRWLSLYSVQKIVVNSKFAKNEMVESGYPASRLVFVPNIVDLNHFGTGDGQLRALTKASEKTAIIGTIGNLRRQKNQQMFVDVMAKVCEQFDGVHGVIIGQVVSDEPNVLEGIVNRIKKLGLNDKVSILGYQTDVPGLMSEIAVFCLTSDYEGTPNVIMEAMAASKPVVATRVGGVPALVQDGVNGFLVEPGDLDGFAAAVLNLLENPELAERMGKAGREMVEREYNPSKAVKVLTDLYTNVMFQKRYP